MRVPCRPYKDLLRLQLRLSRNSKIGRRASAVILRTIDGLPELTGSPIFIRTLPSLAAHRGMLLSADSAGRGTAVHAASFLRKREIVLETELLRSSAELRLIVIHEIFHFVWWRLGNGRRREFRELLETEVESRARGELGESSAVQKLALGGGESQWRNYVCESFCDSAAWIYAGNPQQNSGTLAKIWRHKRQQWFEIVFAVPRPS